MCINPMSVKHGDDWILVPCGKCIECKKDRQNETAILCCREAEKRGSFEFVTLTYSNDTIPMYYTVTEIDDETGECEYLGTPARVPDSEMEADLRREYFSHHTDCFDEYLCSFDEEPDVTFAVTPSLCRKDVQDWFKRCRINYSRKHGKKADFGFVCCGEYGPNTGRPHWHIGIFGLTHEEVCEFTADWNKRYGFDMTKTVAQFGKNQGEDPWEAVGKYVGKYIAKPEEFESRAVNEGRVEKPRRQSSIYFGSGDDKEALMRYHLCYDMVGPYDPDHITELKLTGEQWKSLADEIIKRKHYKLNGKDYKLPRRIQRAIFYKQYDETQLDGTTKRKERSTQIQAMVALVVRDHFNQNFAEQLRALESQYGDEIPYSAIREIVHNENHARQVRAKNTFKAQQRQYRKSYF